MEKVTIIAEAGVNHNGEFDKALELIDIAKKAGADFVKFQTFKTELNISRSAAKADYQKQHTGNQETQFEMVKKLEFTFDQFLELKSYCDKTGIGFLSTPFDIPSIELLDDLQEIFKLPSGEITNYPYLTAVAKLKKPVILSTGMANLKEVESALNIFLKEGISRKDITILHCNTEYPTPMRDVNLRAMTSMANKLNVKTGYSDHTLGIEVPIAAVALGAKVIEKHFTISHTLPGPDHKASLEPSQLSEMIRSIRNIEMALLGNGEKAPSPSELRNIKIVRKSIHSKNQINAGEIIVESDLIALRPESGISPMHWNEVIGMTANKTILPYQSIRWDDLNKK